MTPTRSLALALAATLCLPSPPSFAQAPNPSVNDRGFSPTDGRGRPLNLDFEAGSLRDWTAEGEAFARQPIEGDAVARRRPDMHSRHAGRFWVGTFEVAGDAPKGTLTSVPFKVTHPWASFLVGGGPHRETRVEVVRADTKEVIFHASGMEAEDMRRAVVDLSKQLDRTIFVRVVDEHAGHWGHVNFDDFRFHEAMPSFANRAGTPLVADVYANNGLSPEAAARAMTVPPGFRVTLVAGEPDVVQPIAFCIDDRGRIWVAEAYSYPRRVPDDQAKDRILIFEDTDGDGKADKRTVFAEKLNLVSGLEVGFGGLWVGAAPYLLFIPDKDGDDRPDGPPQKLLDGWGMQDTHETLNSFTWGPDGWLYGCHGVFTNSNVGKPGTPSDQRAPINGGIWRYHPTKHVFEVFAHGTSNPWGIDFNDRGQAFLTSCVIPHLYHVIQGGRYERQAGAHFNPYTYDDIKTIADHRHYVGSNPHAGNGRSDAAGGGHAHSGAMIYLGGLWPAEYRDTIFMNNIHGARLNRDILTPKGSSFVGSHAPDFLRANDSWSQVVNIQMGPDGNAYMIDWYDKNQCHRTEENMHDRTNGRIFKISYGDSRSPIVGLSRQNIGGVLAALLNSPNDWDVRHARRILQERGANQDLRGALAASAFDPIEPPPSPPDRKQPPPVKEPEPRRLRALWALHSAGGLDEGHVRKGLSDEGPYIRAWTIQLAMEDKKPSSETLAKFAVMAKSDPSPVVRLYLASALQRMEPERRWDILAGLLQHAEDADDHNLPLMYWYAAEPLAAVDARRAAALAAGSRIPLIPSFMTRRIAAVGSPEAIAMLVEAIGKAERSARRLELLIGINEALQGRRRVAMPEAWPEVYRKILVDGDAAVRSQATALGMTFGDRSALEAMRKVLADASASTRLRREALAALLKARDPGLAASVRPLLEDPALRGEAIRALAAAGDPKTPETLLGLYAKLTPAERRDVLNALASRVEFARALLDAVAAKKVPSTDLTADLVRQIRNLKDKALDEQIARVWGTVREMSGDAAQRIARYRAIINRPYSEPRDVSLGRAVFAKVCAQCHTLFGTGAKIGPELTGSNRADLDYLLSNVLDPNALIGKDYLAHVVATRDGRILTGIIQREDKDSITLATANETLTIPKTEIEERRESDKSMMPDDLLAPLSDHEVRSLVAYLASPSQVPMLATPENAAGFFNGKDLAGWNGETSLWSVEGGEIVGRTSGLKRNEFLRSDLVAGDFRLSLKVKLVKNEGNSGLQFRSEALPDGEMRGYQADIGPGWWGKLYEENARGLLWDRSGEAHVKPGEWNTYEVEAIGSRLRTRINGQPCVDLDDPAGARRGLFAFQLHSGGPTEVRFKDIKLEVIARGGR